MFRTAEKIIFNKINNKFGFLTLQSIIKIFYHQVAFRQKDRAGLCGLRGKLE